MLPTAIKPVHVELTNETARILHRQFTKRVALLTLTLIFMLVVLAFIALVKSFLD